MTGLWMVRSRDARQAARQAVDEILGLFPVALGQFRNHTLGILILERVVTDQGHRMHPDVVAHYEFHTHESYAIGGQAPPNEMPPPDWPG
jgi:hypothetical protein